MQGTAYSASQRASNRLLHRPKTIPHHSAKVLLMAFEPVCTGALGSITPGKGNDSSVEVMGVTQTHASS